MKNPNTFMWNLAVHVLIGAIPFLLAKTEFTIRTLLHNGVNEFFAPALMTAALGLLVPCMFYPEEDAEAARPWHRFWWGVDCWIVRLSIPLVIAGYFLWQSCLSASLQGTEMNDWWEFHIGQRTVPDSYALAYYFATFAYTELKLQVMSLATKAKREA